MLNWLRAQSIFWIIYFWYYMRKYLTYYFVCSLFRIHQDSLVLIITNFENMGISTKVLFLILKKSSNSNKWSMTYKYHVHNLVNKNSFISHTEIKLLKAWENQRQTRTNNFCHIYWFFFIPALFVIHFLFYFH